MRARVLFIAGATGATGRTLVRLAEREAVEIVPHVRPKAARPDPVDPRASRVELSDERALVAALERCTTVVQLIGTTRRRFSSGDTYETSDVGTTRQLVAAARKASIDHVVLLSSLGAGRPVGAYLAAKARAEAIVRDCGIAYTIVRPAAFVGEGHEVPRALRLVTRLPGLAALRPIEVERLASGLLRIARARAPLGLVEGAAVQALDS